MQSTDAYRQQWARAALRVHWMAEKAGHRGSGPGEGGRRGVCFPNVAPPATRPPADRRRKQRVFHGRSPIICKLLPPTPGWAQPQGANDIPETVGSTPNDSEADTNSSTRRHADGATTDSQATAKPPVPRLSFRSEDRRSYNSSVLTPHDSLHLTPRKQVGALPAPPPIPKPVLRRPVATMRLISTQKRKLDQKLTNIFRDSPRVTLVLSSVT
ncbi:hypothetical protein DIPPA_12826 [Diplonema papillatum]|nr:hypothetical protein DIPPA_12826 [Diplonema papillatum]